MRHHRHPFSLLVVVVLLMGGGPHPKDGPSHQFAFAFEGESSTSAQEDQQPEGDCPFGIYGSQDSECICMSTGLWGIAQDYCSVPFTLHGVRNRSQSCVLNNFSNKVRHLEKVLTLETAEVAQLSQSMHRIIDRFDSFTTSVSFQEDVYPHQSVLISYGEKEWKLSTPDNETYCLVHRGDPYEEWCLFDDVSYASRPLLIKELVPKCESHFPKILSTVCNPLKGNRSCTGDEGRENDTRPAEEVEDDDDDAFLKDGDGDGMSISNNNSAGGDKMKKTEMRLLGPLEDDPELVNVDRNVIKKRDGGGESDKNGSSAGPSGGNKDLLEEDEDKMSAGLEEIGHKLMRDQIDGYVDTVVAQLTGLSKDGSPIVNPSTSSDSPSAKSRLPVFKILSIIKLIMQKTCSAVKEDYFDLALNSFLKVQFESFHAKEPYLTHNAFLRIAYALKKCYNGAKPHVFATQRRNDSCPVFSSGKSMITTTELDIHGDGREIIHLNDTPPYASGLLPTGTREPLVETVWKMLVNAHSYCYPYFKAYFNDHHTLTVALLPLFNNQIQDIWLKDGGYDTKNGRLYGGLLGDTEKVVRDVDNCVAASRHISQYPWYMSRPIRDSNNKWRKRKRRDAEGNPQQQQQPLTSEQIGGIGSGSPFDPDNLAPTPIFIDSGKKLCLFDPDDPVAFLGKPICT